MNLHKPYYPPRKAALLLLLAASLAAPLAVHAQTSLQQRFGVPMGVDPGSVMSREQYFFSLRRNQPYLFRPITERDAKGLPPEEQAPITAQPGVFPNQQSVQGILVAPNGQVIIGEP